MTQFPESFSVGGRICGRIFGCLPAKVGQAIESDRANLHALGWRRTKLTDLKQQPSLLSGLVDAEWTLTGFDRRPWPKASALPTSRIADVKIEQNQSSGAGPSRSGGRDDRTWRGGDPA